MKQIKWSYGVTTVPQRTDDLLPRTLASLAPAGFDAPRLFVDGARSAEQYGRFGLEITTHWPAIRTFGNWALALVELYLRDPAADRYAIFQDDMVTYRGLRQYLERCDYPERGYWNLYTFPRNQKLAPKGRTGWYLSNQHGRGAVALMFSKLAVTTLLKHPQMVNHPQNAHKGHKSLDGAILRAFKNLGWREYVHNPSLVQHTGRLLSSIHGKKCRHPLAESFRGENFDAMELLP